MHKIKYCSTWQQKRTTVNVSWYWLSIDRWIRSAWLMPWSCVCRIKVWGIDLSMSMPWVWEQVRLKVRVVVTLALASRVMVHFSQSLWPVPSAWIWSGWFARPRTIRTLLPAAVVHSIYETWLFSSALGCCNARIRVKIMLPGFAFFSSGFHGGDW